MSAVLTVSQINTYIKSIIDYDEKLKNIYASGEISNFTNHYRTGHFYFTLKDANAAIKVVMFRTSAQRVRFNIENGMKVVVRGSISVFERDGVYQLYAEDIAPDGIGALNLAFEQLKTKLSALGMFDSAHKKPLPKFPKKIGVITSPTGAAVHDIFTVLERRYPLSEIVFEGVAVQGGNAAPEIVAAIEKFNRLNAADVLIVGRGGGSIEDLWAFNEEEVAYAIFNSNIPIISAVGHETDFTIADFVSDMRAATPSAAAEIAVPDWREALYTVDKMSESLNGSIYAVISGYASLVQNFEKLLGALSPENVIDSYIEKIRFISDMLDNSVLKCFDNYSGLLNSYAVKLDSLSPLKIMSKGYCMATDINNFTISSASKINRGDKFNLIFSDGEVICTADETKINDRTDRS